MIHQTDPIDSTSGNGELRALHYYSWLFFEEKWTGAVLLLSAIFVCMIVFRSTDSLLWTLGALSALAASVWRHLIPVHFEINSDGIARWNVGRRRLIRWESIKSYELYPHGVLLLPNREHFPLEPFHGHFIPVPAEFEAELEYRLRFFIDKSILNIR